MTETPSIEKDLLALRREALSEQRSDPYSRESYEEFKKFAFDNDLANKPLFWLTKLEFEYLSKEEIEKWESAIRQEHKATEISDKLSHMYDIVRKEYPIELYIDKMLEYSRPDVSLATELYYKHEHDFVGSQRIFRRLVEMYLAKDMIPSVGRLYEERLMIPHEQVQETFSEYSAFLTKYMNEKYTEKMRTASKAINGNERKQRYYEVLEQAVRNDPDSPKPWIKYMQNVSQYSKDKFAHLKIFYRSLFAGSRSKLGDPEWFEVWSAALELMSSSTQKHRMRKKFAQAFVKNYPENAASLTELAWTLESETDIESLENRIYDAKFYGNKEADWRNLGIVLLTVHRAMIKGQIFSDSLFEAIRATFYHFDHIEISIFCLEMCGASSDFSVRDWVQMLVWVDNFTERRNARFWLTALDIYARSFLPGDREEIKTVIGWMEDKIHHFDQPWRVYYRLQDYYYTTITSSSTGPIRLKLQEMKKLIEEKEQESSGVVVQEESIAADTSSKVRSRDDDTLDNESPQDSKRAKTEEAVDVEPVRSREQFRVKLYPLNAEASEEDIHKFFQGYASPISMLMSNTNEEIDDNFAVLEFSSEQEVLTCLTRQFKPLLGEIVHLERIFGATVWVTNYPPDFDKKAIENMILELTGQLPLEIRLPSQTDNKERRFFYADFPDSDIALFVRNQLAGHNFEGHELQAEISNPALKKAKSQAHPSYQIHLHNLDFHKTTEDTLRSFFQSWGEVAGVHLPLSADSTSKGYLNNGFAFVTFATEESASEAIAKGKAEIDGRIVDISAVKKRKSADKKATAFEDDKCITIHNLNETVNEAQLKKMLDEKIGHVNKVSLKPSRNLALAEFEAVKDAGKAGFILGGLDYEGRVLSVGSKKDFFKEKESIKVPAMMSPMLMRRKRK